MTDLATREAWVGPTATTAVQPGFEALGTALIDTTFVVLDLETTGLQPSRDRITEVGAVKVRGGEVLGELRTFVRPGRPVPPAVTAVTGITDAMVREAPPLDAVLPILLDFLDGTVLVAHNAAFDVGFLRAACASQGWAFEPETVDTARLARRLLRDEVRDVRLATLARHLRARTLPEHRALIDARATVDVLHGLLERAGTLGATTLEDLRALQRSSSDRAFRRIGLVHDAPTTTGVYRFRDERGEVLYVGKATNLRSRLRTYFGQDRRRRVADLVRETDHVDWTPTPTLLEAEVRELREIRAAAPRYNRRSRHPSPPAWLAVTREPFPRLSVVRSPGTRHRRTLGPLPTRRAAEQLAEALRQVSAIRPCTPRLRRAQDHQPCVLKELGRCGAPCDGTQDHGAYEQIVAEVEATLDNPEGLLAALRRRMVALARAGRYEQAREVRHRLHGVARTLATTRRVAALRAVDVLVAARHDAEAVEVVALQRGRLVTTTRLRAGTDDDAVRRAVAPDLADAATAEDTSREEALLLLAWLDRPGVRLVVADPGWAEPVAGGATLASTVEEARRVGRQLRRDHQLLSGTKVVRHEAAG